MTNTDPHHARGRTRRGGLQAIRHPVQTQEIKKGARKLHPAHVGLPGAENAQAAQQQAWQSSEKSVLVRAGIQALAAMSDARFLVARNIVSSRKNTRASKD